MARLGDHDLVRKWSQKHNRWGPDNQWSAWFGGGVVDALVEVLDLHLHSPLDVPSRYAPRPAVLGAVPWMTHEKVIDRLTHCQTCVIMTKPRPGAQLPPQIIRYAADGEGFPKHALHELDDWGPKLPGGHAPTIGPWTPYPLESEPLGPVRVVGYRGGGKAPLLHTKLLVLGVIYWLEDDEWLTERLTFRPQRVWWGSANFTRGAENHLEMGTLSDDPSLAEHAADYLVDLIRLSEPFHSESYWPTPELAAAGWDDAAFQEYTDSIDWGDYADEDDW